MPIIIVCRAGTATETNKLILLMKRIHSARARLFLLLPFSVLLFSVILASCTDLGAWDQLLALVKVEVWYDATFRWRTRITFNNGAQNSDLWDFPVLVVLDPTRIDYSNCQADGSDIRFGDCQREMASHCRRVRQYQPFGHPDAHISGRESGS